MIYQQDEYGARGGVEFGIMSTTKSKSVAVQYSAHGGVPTIFQIEIGQVDRGAELNWISVRTRYMQINTHFKISLSLIFPAPTQQFPGEDEVVIPPLSNLEVTGEPYLSYLRNLEGVDTQILIVPLRVNVNIKSKTMEELESTRKGVLLSAIMDLETESEQEIGELTQALGEITALSAGQETEWFNDQEAHSQVDEEKSSDSHIKASAQRRRKDLLEL